MKQTDHAEMLAVESFVSKKNRGALCLLVQDAYPCDHCHNALLQRSRATDPAISIVVKVTANKGVYSACHTINGEELTQNGSVPCIIYYHGGACVYSNIILAMQNGGAISPPNGFPDHPDFDQL